ncbi:hypothetical protein O6H91_17G024400 [Diphasiastrum complanatum]|uniref:Uncharacterized protein n=1 Tax=Diphasiastrum complanatum TaxID=34168 RepID=A0ACC2B532_DIPCM|nr:hypothetical protein O6H91_17G024400 [Diphasiastrum complanatum]
MTMFELSKILPCVSSAAAVGLSLKNVAQTLWTPQRAIVRPVFPALISLSVRAQDRMSSRSSVPPLVVENIENAVVFPEIENSGLRSRSRSVTKGSFQNDVADIGRVKCNRGCRPVYNEDISLDEPEDDWLTQENAANILESRIAVYRTETRRQDQEERRQSSFSWNFAEFLSEVWMEKAIAEKYYEAALHEDRHNAKLLVKYAQFAWKSLDNVSKAESLFKEAISESPDDPVVLASYAHFLWQTED